MANRTLAIIGRVMNWHAARVTTFARRLFGEWLGARKSSWDRVLSDDELRAFGELQATAGLGSDIWCVYQVSAIDRCATKRSSEDEMGRNRWERLDATSIRNKTGVELVRPLSGAAR